MMAETEMSPTAERVSRLFQHLGIRRAHLAGAMSEVGDLVEALPELVASLTLICPFQAIAASRLRLSVRGCSSFTATLAHRAKLRPGYCETFRQR